MRWTMVIPVVDPERGLRCVESIHPDIRDRVCVVNNGVKNLRLPDVGRRVNLLKNEGVSHAWNLGAQYMRDYEADMMFIVSTSIVFGESGGRDLLQLASQASGTGLETIGCGWHLIGLRRDLLEVVGSFDENFFPAYMEDTDYLYRMSLAGFASPRENGRSLPYVQADAMLQGVALSIQERKIPVNFDALRAYYVSKWGGDQGDETYDSPFNTGRSWRWWPHREDGDT